MTAGSDVKKIRLGKLGVPELVGMAEKHYAAQKYDGVLSGLWNIKPSDDEIIKSRKSDVAVVFALQELLERGEVGRDAFRSFCENDPHKSLMGLRVLQSVLDARSGGGSVPEATQFEQGVYRLASDLYETAILPDGLEAEGRKEAYDKLVTIRDRTLFTHLRTYASAEANIV